MKSLLLLGTLVFSSTVAFASGFSVPKDESPAETVVKSVIWTLDQQTIDICLQQFNDSIAKKENIRKMTCIHEFAESPVSEAKFKGYDSVPTTRFTLPYWRENTAEPADLPSVEQFEQLVRDGVSVRFYEKIEVNAVVNFTGFGLGLIIRTPYDGDGSSYGSNFQIRERDIQKLKTELQKKVGTQFKIVYHELK